jgi:MFS family permease
MKGRERHQQWLAFFEMFLVSMAANALAPLITTFQDQYKLSITTSSLFPVFLSAGGISANFIGTFIISRIGIRKYNFIFLVSLGFTAILFYFSNSAALLFAAVFVLGFTTGTGMAVTSTILSHLDHKLQNFGLYHAFFGLGGIITPALIGIILHNKMNYQLIFILMFLFAAGTSIFLFFARFLSDHIYEKVPFLKTLSILKMRVVYLSLIILVFYAASEIGMVLWSSNLFIEAFNFTKESSALFLSGFWLIYTLGRVFAQQIESFFKFQKTIIFSVILVFISIIILLWQGWPVAFWFAALGMAPIFPITQKYVLQHIDKSKAGMFNGMLFGFLGIGNIILPGLMGVLGGINIYYAFFIPIASMLVILVVFRLLIKV